MDLAGDLAEVFYSKRILVQRVVFERGRVPVTKAGCTNSVLACHSASHSMPEENATIQS